MSSSNRSETPSTQTHCRRQLGRILFHLSFSKTIIDWFRTLSGNLLRVEKIKKVSKVFCNQLFFKHKHNICLHKIIGLNKYLKGHIIHFPVPKFHIIWSSCSFHWVITVWAPKHCPKDWYCPGSIPLQDVYNVILTTTLYFLTSSLTLCLSGLMKTNSAAFRVLPDFGCTGVCLYFLLYTLTNRINI